MLSRAARPHMTHIVVSIIVLSERICKEKKNTARENLVGFLWIVTEHPRPAAPGQNTKGAAAQKGAAAPEGKVLFQQFAVVCAAHGEGGGGAAVAEGERCVARTEGCNIGEGEGGSAAF